MSAIIQYKASDMILHIYIDASYLSEPWARSRTGGYYCLSSLPTDPKKAPNLPPPENGPIYTECRILKHVVASAAEAEVGVLFHNGQTAVPLRITLHELGFTKPPTPIKIDNSAAEGIVTNIVRQKRYKSMDMRFYWMKDRVKQKDFFVYWKPGSQKWGVLSRNITHHITVGKFVLRVCIWKISYLKQIKRSCKNGKILCSHQSIRLQSYQTVLFYKVVLMPYIRTDTQIPQQ